MRDEVAAHYRSKGYSIRQNVRVRGQSGAVHAVEMVAQGALGNLVIAFEDAGGLEGPEIHAVRRVARDIGASGVVAARRFPDGLRRQAAQAGVVLLDEEALRAAPMAAPREPDELEYPPWPEGPGARPEPRDSPEPRRPASAGKSTDPGFWRYPRAAPANVVLVHHEAERAPAARPAAPTQATFDWLEPQGAPPETTRPVRPAQASTGLGRWLLAALVAGSSAGAVFYGLLRFVG